MAGKLQLEEHNPVITDGSIPDSKLRGSPALPRWKRIAFGLGSFTLAGAIWFPLLHLLFRPSLADYRPETGIGLRTRMLVARQIAFRSDFAARARELASMRTGNFEWDFMGRTYLVLALANMAEREPASESGYLNQIDEIIDDTLRLEERHGMFYFLMDYAKSCPFVYQPARSLFIDGEIALMLGARRMLEENTRYRELMRDRLDTLVSRMRRTPVLCAESYPDECWVFCNTLALAALRIGDFLDQTDHSAFFKQWIRTAKAKLVHPETGLLVSEFSTQGEWQDGPEGSSIWMAAHCLQLIDREFAEDQYQRAKQELAREFLGFGGAREWPRSWQGPVDVDSGPTVPLLEFNAGSSGLAFVGAAAFDDDDFLLSLLMSVNFAGFPVAREGQLRYLASNQVGDAVLLYALVQGPLWNRVLNGNG